MTISLTLQSVATDRPRIVGAHMGSSFLVSSQGFRGRQRVLVVRSPARLDLLRGGHTDFSQRIQTSFSRKCFRAFQYTSLSFFIALFVHCYIFFPADRAVPRAAAANLWLPAPASTVRVAGPRDQVPDGRLRGRRQVELTPLGKLTA